MRISIVNESKQNIGGGFSFTDNITKGLKDEGIDLVDWREADIVLIPSASMITKELFREMKEAEKKLVLRVDNALRNTRNRGAGMTRMKEMAQGSDVIVYQSLWAKGFLKPFLGKDGIVIHNSVDETIFNTDGAKLDFSKKGNPIYLYSRFNRDETKMWEVTWYQYQIIQRENPYAYLALVGQFSDELRQYNFDFFNNERYEYLGVMNDAESMARLYRGCDYLFANYFNDCFSNSYIEALLCGCKPISLYNELRDSGGSGELLGKFYAEGEEYYYLNRMVREYINLFEVFS